MAGRATSPGADAEPSAIDAAVEHSKRFGWWIAAGAFVGLLTGILMPVWPGLPTSSGHGLAYSVYGVLLGTTSGACLAFVICVFFRAGKRDELQSLMPSVTLCTFLLITLMTSAASVKDGGLSPVGVITGALSGLVGAIITLVGAEVWILGESLSQARATIEDRTVDIAASAKSMLNSSAAIQDTTKHTAGSALDALSQALRLERTLFEGGLADKVPGEVHGAVQVLGKSFENWNRHMEEARGCEPLQRLLLGCFATYYREEAFDIGRRELVTNARNFTFLLLRTLTSLLGAIGEDGSSRNVVWVAVTPVHPKDWYNWPHGTGDPDVLRHHYEAPFLGDFHRMLAGMIGSHGGRVRHERFVLCAQSGEDGDPWRGKLGWAVEEEKHLSAQALAEYSLCPVAMPASVLSQVKCDGCEFCASLGHYYALMTDEASFPQTEPEAAGRFDRLVTPMWNPVKWKRGINERRMGTDGRPGDKSEFAKELYDRAEVVQGLSGRIQRCPGYHALVNAAAEFSSRKFREASERLASGDALAGAPTGPFEEWWKENQAIIMSPLELADAMLRGDKPEVSGFHTDSYLRCLHEGSVLIRGSVPAEVELHSLLRYGLNTLSCCRAGSRPSQVQGWPHLGEVFACDLHGADRRAYAAPLSAAGARSLTDFSIEPEFHLFGIQDGTEPVDWMVAITTNIQYPFELARVRLWPREHAQAYVDFVKGLKDRGPERPLYQAPN